MPGRLHPRQRHRLHHLRGDLGLVGRHHAGRRTHRSDGTPQAWLFAGHRHRFARWRRHARLPDPALEHHDHLRRARRRLDHQAVHGRPHSGPASGRLLHVVGDDPHDHSPRPGSGERAGAAQSVLERSLCIAQGSRPRPVPDRLRARLDVWRHCHAVRGGGGRCPWRRHRRPRSGLAHPQRRARDRHRLRRHLLDDRPHPAWRLDPWFGGRLPRHSRQGRRLRAGAGFVALPADAGPGGVLPGARLLPRRLLDDRA